MTHVNILMVECIVSETQIDRQTDRQTDRQDKFVIDIYLYIYMCVAPCRKVEPTISRNTVHKKKLNLKQ